MNAVQYNPFNSEAHADPFPMYRQLREQEPVHWSERMDAWVLTRYDDVVGVLKDPRFSANRRNARNRFAEQAAAVAEAAGPPAQATSMLSADPPAHTRLRGLVSKAFTPKAVESLRPRVHELVDELLDGARGAGRFDVIEDLAYPLPVVVIAERLGVPAEDRAQFKRWSDDVVATLGGRLLGPEVQERASRSTQELATYFQGVIAKSSERVKNMDKLGLDYPLFGEGESLDLDSLDILELALSVEKRFDVSFADDVDPTVFETVSILSKHIESQLPA